MEGEEALGLCVARAAPKVHRTLWVDVNGGCVAANLAMTQVERRGAQGRGSASAVSRQVRVLQVHDAVQARHAGARIVGNLSFGWEEGGEGKSKMGRGRGG